MQGLAGTAHLYFRDVLAHLYPYGPLAPQVTGNAVTVVGCTVPRSTDSELGTFINKCESEGKSADEWVPAVCIDCRVSWLVCVCADRSGGRTGHWLGLGAGDWGVYIAL